MDIGFQLKQCITFFVEPFGMVLTLLTVGLYFLFKNRSFLAKLFVSSGFGLLLLFSYPAFSNFLITQLENRYPPYNSQIKDIKYIHVLGAGHNNDKNQTLSSQLSNASIKRVVEGIIIHKNIPNSILIFSGYRGTNDFSTAEMHTKLALALGVDTKDIITNSQPKDTEEEALFVKSIVGDKKFILVTSATHMPRAMRLFQKLGLHPLPAPTQFYKRENTIALYFKLPNAGTLETTRVALHEYLGMLWGILKQR